ncbi:MAG: DUF2254 domain-containing protein [Solirubrobacterales bacterium]
MSWRTRWRIYEYVRNSLWIVPALFVLLAIAMGIVIPDIDESVETTIGISYGAEAGRGVLGALAGGMITFTGFVFSILLLAVQFGSSQFSPRMLRRFLRDPTTKVSLGVFMATFIYALLVLRVVGTGGDAEFVPSNSISISLATLLLSMVMFLRLISRTTQGLRVAAVLQELGRDARRVVDRVYPDPVGEDEAAQPAIAGPATTVAHRGEPGVIQSIDAAGLVERAAAAGTVIELLPRVGELIATGAPLFRVAEEGEEIDDAWLQGAVAVGDERTMRQDPAFAFRLLADISAKALSPGVNDPTTAIQALDQIELLLRQIGGRRLAPGVRRDEGGVARLLYPVPSWEDFLGLALDETRQFGEGSVQVTRRLRALLEDLREAVPERRRAAIDAELELLDAAADRTFVDRGDRRSAAAGDRQGLGAGRAAA